MARHSDAQILRLGTITLVVMALIMAAAFNLSKFPGFSGTTYQAWFAEGSGLRAGNMVQVGGIRSGRGQGLELVVGDGFREMHQHRGRIGTGVEDFAQRLRGGLRARLHRGVQVRA